MENKRQHLQMIQEIISRMASNSFIIKGWSVAFFGALFTLLISKTLRIDKMYMLMVILVTVVLFWIHDAYYLNLERQFRNLYNEVIEKEENEIDFKMTPIKKEKLCCVFLRPILIITYGSITLITVVLLFLLK